MLYSEIHILRGKIFICVQGSLTFPASTQKCLVSVYVLQQLNVDDIVTLIHVRLQIAWFKCDDRRKEIY